MLLFFVIHNFREKSRGSVEDDSHIFAADVESTRLRSSLCCSLFKWAQSQLSPAARSEMSEDNDDPFEAPHNGTYEINVFFEFVVPGVLLNGIGILGFLGNIISIAVLSRPQMKSSINCILIGMYISLMLKSQKLWYSQIGTKIIFWSLSQVNCWETELVIRNEQMRCFGRAWKQAIKSNLSKYKIEEASKHF